MVKTETTSTHVELPAIVSLVTGGTRGIGSVIAQRFRDNGRRVLTISRQSAELENHLTIDLTSNEAIDQLMKALRSVSIENLVLCHRYRGSSWDEEVELMLTMCAKLIESLKDKFCNPSSIVIVGSNAAHYYFKGQSAAYHITRGGLESLVKYFAVELGERGIRSNSVLPGTIFKPENTDYFSANPQFADMLTEITPLKRMGRSEDVADVVDFLCSESASFVTGHSLCLDGGLRLVSQETISRSKFEF